MKFVVLACLLAVAVARPDYLEHDSHGHDHIEILEDERHYPDQEGKYSFVFKTEDGIERSESGGPLADVEYNPVGQQGEYSFDLPNGEKFYMKFVADENGFQPESPFLPVAPEFPHPIPQFVLDQIEKAAREDAGKEFHDDDDVNSYRPPQQYNL